MPNNCAVYGCNSHKTRTKGIKYFSFPSDKKTRKKWEWACHRADKMNLTHAVICSLHFQDQDYEDERERER